MKGLAANLSMLFLDVPAGERIRTAASFGFRACEFQFLAGSDAAALGRSCRHEGLECVLFNADAGDPAQGEAGFAGVVGGLARFDRSIDQALTAALALGCRQIHVLSGRRDPAIGLEQQLDLAVERFHRAALTAAGTGVTILIEPLSPGIAPGYLVSDVETAYRIVRSVGLPSLAVQFDLFHVAAVAADPSDVFRTNQSMIKHVQIAAPGSRAEPDPADERTAGFLRTLSINGYGGWVGCEYRPRGSTQEGLTWAGGWGIGPGRGPR